MYTSLTPAIAAFGRSRPAAKHTSSIRLRVMEVTVTPATVDQPVRRNWERPPARPSIRPATSILRTRTMTGSEKFHPTAQSSPLRATEPQAFQETEDPPLTLS